MNWQPIETAPKDGTAIDVWVRSIKSDAFGHFTGYRIPDVSWFCGEWADQGMNPLLGMSKSWTITHWMPLPEGPTEQTGDTNSPNPEIGAGRSAER